MEEIKGVGHRVGDAYWLASDKSKHLLKKQPVQVAMALDAMSNHFGYPASSNNSKDWKVEDLYEK